jgi:hypothetical protein
MRLNTVNNMKLTIIAKIRETCTCSSSPGAVSVYFGGSKKLAKLVVTAGRGIVSLLIGETSFQYCDYSCL